MISTQNFQQAVNQIRATKEKPIIVKAQDLEFNRKILEYGKFQILLDIHEAEGRDKPKQLASGFNHVLAKIAAKNKVAIGIDLKKLASLDKKQKAIGLARIRQNIKICRKARCSLALVNSEDDKDARDLLLSLGASTQQTKEII